MDRDGLLLCDLQANIFEKTVEQLESSSEIFVRRFMNSQIAKRIDNESILESNLQTDDILNLIEEEYGVSKYGTVKYTQNEIHWIGYIYRYFAITYELSSVQIYKILKPKELRTLYLPYHTMDPAQAIERIAEEKGLLPRDDIQELSRQYKIFQKIRNKKIDDML